MNWFRSRIAAVCGLALAMTLTNMILTRAPARAQFFFPFFFDNRPTARPAPAPHPPAHPRPKPRAVEKKPEAATKPGHGAAAAATPAPAPPAVDAPPPPYQPQLLRLAEIMGALSALQPLCAGASAQPGAAPAPNALRAQMEALMAAENAGPRQRERLAGAYNRGYDGWRAFYRDCTIHARVATARFEQEGARLAHDISARYRAN